MERQLKFFVLVSGVLVCAALAPAATYYTPYAGTANYNWNQTSTWLDPATGWGEAPVLPLAVDTLNLAYTGINGGATGNPGEAGGMVTLPAGYTGTAKNLIMGGKSYYYDFGAPYNQMYGDRLDIYGSLQMTASDQSLYFGNTSSGSINQFAETVLNIYAGADVDIYALRVNNTSTTAAAYRINQMGGTLDLTAISLPTTNALTIFDISGGVFTCKDNSYGGAFDSAAEAKLLISGTAKVVLNKGLWTGRYIDKGLTWADGTLVTAANVDSLLNVVDIDGGANVEITLVPEPATLSLLGLGAVAMFRRKR